MNKELFDSMQKQMTPSPQVRAALTEQLARPAKKRPTPWMKYGAVAACAALVIGVYAVYQAGKPEGKAALHSYVTVDDLTGFVLENATTATGGSEGGDQDMGMTPEDLTAAMLDVGYTQEEIDEYQAIGYQMTWAKWWKFVDGQKNSEGDDPFNLDSLKVFSQKELYVHTGALPAPNTGDLPGGAYIGDAPSQEEALNAYQKLMDRFNGVYPDWYGGAYIDSSGWLVVQLVESKDPADKSLELQVLDWTGSDQVMFSSCKYSLAQLTGLMDQLNALPDADPKCREVMASWGIDEEHNRIELTLTEVNGHVLAVLCRMDPEDDAIYVQVGQRVSMDIANDKPSVIPEGEEPVSYDIMPGGATVPDDEDLIAEEPWYDGAHYDVEDLPQQKLPAFGVDSAPEEDSNAYEPQG
ncbi:MAG: hypothetical protein HFF49_06705 [Lawsonibacter sp.]|nr:hypothetical protein [Lawsonibacter sp.]